MLKSILVTLRYREEVREVSLKKNILMDLIHNGGGGVSGRVHFSRIFFTFNVKKYV